MPGTQSALLWGPTFENVLRVPYPLDNLRPRRRPRPGSTRGQLGDGTPVGWSEGKEYVLDLELRWTPYGDLADPVGTGWSGPIGVEEFLSWAPGHTFRFVPDVTVPDFYVDLCSLVEPFEDPAPGLERDGSFRQPILITNPLVPFSQALRGIMFEYAPGMSLMDPVAATFARATAATRRGLPGTLVSAVGASDASGVLRDRHYEGTLRTTLLEAARTRVVVDPENFGAWTTIGTPVLTSGQADPFGGNAAYLIDDNDAGAFEYIGTPGDLALTDGERAFSVFVKQGTASQQWFRIQGAATRHQVVVTWTAGVPALTTGGGSGTRFTPENWGGGWWRVSASAVGVVGADTNNRLEFGPGAGASVTEVGTGYFFGANAWDAPFPSSYQGPALTTRNSDQLSWAFTYKPQAMFLLVDFVENEQPDLSDTRIITICNNTESPQRLLLLTAVPDSYRIYHEPTAVLAVQQNVDKNPVRGDRMQVIGLLYPDGSVKIGASKNGDAEVFSSQSGANALAAAWSGQTLGVGSRAGSGSNSGFRAFARVKIGPLTFGSVVRDTIAKAQSA